MILDPKFLRTLHPKVEPTCSEPSVGIWWEKASWQTRCSGRTLQRRFTLPWVVKKQTEKAMKAWEGSPSCGQIGKKFTSTCNLVDHTKLPGSCKKTVGHHLHKLHFIENYAFGCYQGPSSKAAKMSSGPSATLGEKSYFHYKYCLWKVHSMPGLVKTWLEKQPRSHL